MYVNPNLISNVTYLKNVNWYRNEYTLKNARKLVENIPVLFQSKNFLIVNKPYDLMVYEYKKTNLNMPTLYSCLRDQFPMYYDPRLKGGFHVLHRLDSVTSGAICIPLNYFSQRLAVDSFLKKNTQKFYLALVYGKMSSESNELSIEVPIGEDIRNFKYSRCAKFGRDGKLNEFCVGAEEAKTKIKILEHGKYKGRECTKVLVQPITGRRHQIRVHLSHVGHPIVGDLAYGSDDYDTYRTMLHSYKLIVELNTKERRFLKAKADDPFVSDVDPDWKSQHIVTQLKI